MERAHPPVPRHFYLAVLGIDPPHQGRGLGSALLAPVLELCDREAVHAYLESSKERNVDFYSRHGFRVTREIRTSEGTADVGYVARAGWFTCVGSNVP